MSRSSGSTQDQRAHARIKAFVMCEIQVGEFSANGILESLSLRGALITSRLVPCKGSAITITVQVPESKKTVSMQGQIVRLARGVYDRQEELFRFGVRLSHVSPESMQLVNALMKRNETGIRLRLIDQQ